MSDNRIKIDYENLIDEYLDMFNISPETNGYKYLKCAILYCIENDAKKTNIQDVCQLIGKKYSRTKDGIYSVSWHAVYMIFKTKNPVLKKIFGSLINYDNKRVTFSQFVKGSAEYLINLAKTREEKNDSNEEAIVRFFELAGISPKYKGYYYLKAELLYCVEQGYKFYCLTKLHSQIAEEYNITTNAIYRAIRCVIDLMVEKTNNYPFLLEVFGEYIDYDTGKLTQTDFIIASLHYLKTHSNKS